MALNDYAGLKQEVIAFSGRDDLSERFDTLLALAETKIFRTNSDKTLRVREMETSAALVTVGGTNLVALPDRFIEARSLKITYGGNSYELTYVSPSAMNEISSGLPSYFTIKNGGIVFNTVPDGAYDLTLEYYAQPLPIDATNSTNDVLTNYPDIYFNCCLAMVYDFTTEPEMSQVFMTKAQASIRGAIKADERAIRKTPTMRVKGARP